MCGIAGEYHYKDQPAGVAAEVLLAVRDHMTCRGPDGSGLWISDDGAVGLAHRRLAILDLSDNGAQPMHSHNQSAVISFNGEIYNFLELRESLRRSGIQFRSESDTEVLLELYKTRGVQFLADLRGMFAFAIWDAEKKELLLARDIFGIKPLYYFDSGEGIYFASQVRALLRYPKVPRALDPVAQCGFFLTGSVPEPHTMFQAIRSLGPGQFMRIKRGGATEVREFNSVEAEFRRPQEKISTLRETLEDSVRKHLLSDAPCGFFLSAGLDSSTLVGVASQIGHPSIKTVTLGFDRLKGTPSDETALAEQTARLYKTDHQTIWISSDDFFAEIARFWTAMDQPSIDGINSYFVSKAARAAGLTVALSGLGADEVCGGYPSFRGVPQSVRTFGWTASVPALGKFFQTATLPLFSALTSPKYSGLLTYGGNFTGAYLLRRGLFLPAELPLVLDAETIRAGLNEAQAMLLDERTIPAGLSPWQTVSLLELTRYMRNQLLRDTDWASMAHALEVRVPFVDPQMLRLAVARSASGNPLAKQELPQTLQTPLPPEIVSRPKTGFSVPVRDWLREASSDRGAKHERGLRGWARMVYESYLQSCA